MSVTAMPASKAEPRSDTPNRRARPKALPRPLITAAKGLAGAGIALLLWQAIPALGLVDPRDLPSVGSIVAAWLDGLVAGFLLSAIGSTLFAWAIGLAISAVIGAVVGGVLGLLPRVERTTRPLLEFLRPIPAVALIPVALIVLGIGLRMELATIVFGSVWPVIFATKAGIESVDPRYQETGTMLGLSRLERIRRIVLPAAMPSVATGVRTAAAIALILAITVEMLTGQPGLGQYLQAMRIDGQNAHMWAAVFSAGLLGYLLNVLSIAVERRFMGWSQEYREQQ